MKNDVDKIIQLQMNPLIPESKKSKSWRMKEEIKDDLTYKIIGCAMKVHSVLGNGFQEVIYQRALAIEMQKQGLGFERELEMPLFYS